jgi:hypothetical protein
MANQHAVSVTASTLSCNMTDGILTRYPKELSEKEESSRTIVKRKRPVGMLEVQARSRRNAPQWSWLLPWAFLALSAVICAAYATWGQSEEYYGTEFSVRPSSFSILSSVRRFLSALDEEHAPLLPLTTSDYVGFTFATLGLMVAAGGGIGGGGM